MKFFRNKAKVKALTPNLKVYEYCSEFNNLPIDAAIAELDGNFGPKINKNFTELFFIIAGKLVVFEDDIKHELNIHDVYIMLPEKKHSLYGEKCTFFISCAPQFKPEWMELLN